MDFPNNLRYTKDHEWIRLEQDGSTATIGITDFAQSELGDIVYVEIDAMNSDIGQDEVFGTVEAVKTVSELFMPVSGNVSEFNEALEDNPELVNDDPYGEGWIIRITAADPAQIDALLTAAEYGEMVSS